MLIDSPADRVESAIGRIDVWQRAATAVGFRFHLTGAGDRWQGGEQILVGRRTGRPRHRVTARLVPTGLPLFEVTAGPARGGQLRLSLDRTGAGVLVTADFGNPAAGTGPFSRVRGLPQARYRRRVLWALRVLLGLVSLEQHQTRVVVAGAIICDGAVLAARRTYPSDVAGKWEFPGGKVGLGESDELALMRELAEELGVLATVGERIGPEISLDVELVLRLYRAEVLGQPVLGREHDELRWLSPDQLNQVDWLDADRSLLPAVTLELRGRR